jgi:hypothetical protein
MQSIQQDFLLLPAAEDHLVPLSQFYAQVSELTAVRSETARLFPRHEQAQSHCQYGNLDLALAVIADWIHERVWTIGSRVKSSCNRRRTVNFPRGHHGNPVGRRLGCVLAPRDPELSDKGGKTVACAGRDCEDFHLAISRICSALRLRRSTSAILMAH